jgi:DNA repair photolyase
MLAGVMGIRIREVRVGGVLTRTRGYLEGICSHSLQPYRGCSFGRSLCGVGCYVQHNGLLLRGEAWGSFVEPRVNAAERYLAGAARERRWARRQQGAFGIFLSSATDPFLPQERVYGVTAGLLDAMAEEPPDVLVVQTHSPSVARERERLLRLAGRCALRVHVSIESDRDRLPGLPAPAASVQARLDAARSLRDAGLRTVITVAPLLPIRDPRGFFERIAAAADAVVIDHFVEGDGSKGGARTLRTPLPGAMERVLPGSSSLSYRDEMVRVALAVMPGRVGVSRDGFAGRFAARAPQPPDDSSAS